MGMKICNLTDKGKIQTEKAFQELVRQLPCFKKAVK
jgi:hypothetical protein